VSLAAKVDRDLVADDMAQMDTQIASAKEQIKTELEKQIADEEIRDSVMAAISDWLDATAETLKSGQIDMAGFATMTPDALSLMAGAHVANPAKVEAGLQNLDKAAKKSDKLSDVKWNADKHGSVNIHTFTIAVSEDKARELIGSEATVAIGLGGNAVYVGLGGPTTVADLKKAIDASLASPNKAVKPVEFSVALGTILETIAAHPDNERQKEMIQPIADMLKSDAAGRDHIRITGEMETNAVKYHFEAEEGVMKAIGKAAAAAQQRRAQRPQ
jgi:hypothetical protein